VTTYWIEYLDGTIKEFEAENDTEAYWYFIMEGDHAYDYGEKTML
jgi:hypothetical protein